MVSVGPAFQFRPAQQDDPVPGGEFNGGLGESAQADHDGVMRFVLGVRRSVEGLHLFGTHRPRIVLALQDQFAALVIPCHHVGSQISRTAHPTHMEESVADQ